MFKGHSLAGLALILACVDEDVLNFICFLIELEVTI